MARHRAAAGGVLLLSAAFLYPASPAAGAGIIDRLPGEGKAVALTFDACETKSSAFFDRAILDYLLLEKLPFTLFVSGKFAQRNAGEIRSIASLAVVEVENHSLSHFQHMESLSPAEFRAEVTENGKLIQELTGRKPAFFRFPGGNHDGKVLAEVEGLGYRVVHWSFESGDPDPKITPERLVGEVLRQVRPGSILIFHINGRGYSTGRALPAIVEGLKRQGYRFVLLKDALPP